MTLPLEHAALLFIDPQIDFLDPASVVWDVVGEEVDPVPMRLPLARLVGDPRSVVGNANQPPAAAVRRNLDPRGAGVERILQQFLYDGCRALDDFAGRNLVGNGTGENGDLRHKRLS